MNKHAFLAICAFALCSSAQSQSLYKNSDLPADVRAKDLLKQLTLDEKISLMMDYSKPIDRLGIKTYNWWNEALHGTARNGLATVFPEPIGMAASFDPDMVYRVFSAVSDETRAKNTVSSSKGSYGRYQGLTMWTPNINIFRDPRWGRGMETYGEDPYLTTVMGVKVVDGLQGNGSGAKYDKLHACAKHFAVHSGPEKTRHSFDVENLPMRDLHETYLPAFKALVKDANVKEVMCAYNSFEGKPCCGSDKLLVQILRKEWNYDGIVVSDCGAIYDFYGKRAHAVYKDAPSSSAAAVLSGTDLECGGSYKSLSEGVKQGLIKESDIDVSVLRLLKARYELGEMDDLDKVSWSKIPYSVVASKKNSDIALEAARKSMVLLQNKNSILPLKKDIKSIAVIGPNANDSIMQWGNYNGFPGTTVTILDGIKRAVSKGCNVIYDQGCGLVTRTINRSVMSECSYNGKKGFFVEYWNNRDQKENSVANQNLNIPFKLCTMGNTVFAPGVNLKSFSGKYHTVFAPKESGEVIFNMFVCGKLQLMVNDKEVNKFNQTYGARKHTYSMQVKAGEKYDIVMNYQQYSGEAQFDFDLGFYENINIPNLVAKTKSADVVVFVGGISPSLEGEEMRVNLPGFDAGDRSSIELPAVQREVIEALHKAGKKVVFVNCSGSAVAMEPETRNCDAILQAWYPGQQGGKAVADVLFGNYNPSGRLPITIYKNTEQLPDFNDYDLKGHTYRFFNQQPLFAFGYGLSYSDFKYGEMKLNRSAITSKAQSLTVSLPVTNMGKRDGEEIVQVYISKKNDEGGPIKTLRGFKRVFVPKGKSVNVSITLTPEQLIWWNTNCNAMDYTPGEYCVMVGKSSDDKNMKKRFITIK